MPIFIVKMPFWWDEEKNSQNFQRYGFSFEEAARVFADPYIYILKGKNPDYLEARFLAIGSLSEDNLDLLLVVFTIRNGDIRIISAHKPKEKFIKIYLNNYYGYSN